MQAIEARPADAAQGEGVSVAIRERRSPGTLPGPIRSLEAEPAADPVPCIAVAPIQHCSFSRVVAIRRRQIEPLLAALRTALGTATRLAPAGPSGDSTKLTLQFDTLTVRAPPQPQPVFGVFIPSASHCLMLYCNRSYVSMPAAALYRGIHVAASAVPQVPHNGEHGQGASGCLYLRTF